MRLFFVSLLLCARFVAAQQLDPNQGSLNAALFPGADLGAKINSAIASNNASYKTIRIPSANSPYTWSTTVTIDPRRISILGDGSGATFINCTSMLCLNVHEPTFSIEAGGVIGHFSMVGNGLAGQIGIKSSGVQSERWDDISFLHFTGKGAISWYLYNSDSTEGWQERIQATKIRIQDGNGLRFGFNRANPQAGSFGYSLFDITCDNEGPGQACVRVASGRVYGSDIRLQGNIHKDGILLDLVETGIMDLNRYFISAEPLYTSAKGTCIHVAKTAKLEGTGMVQCNGSAIVNDSGNTFTQHLRIVPIDSSQSAAVIGTFPNFQGTGEVSTASIMGVHNLSAPLSQFGSIDGETIKSTYTTMYNMKGNGHFFFSCPFTYPDLSACSVVGQVTNSGAAIFGTYSPPAGTSAPVGACTTAGTLAITADGHATYCKAEGLVWTRLY